MPRGDWPLHERSSVTEFQSIPKYEIKFCFAWKSTKLSAKISSFTVLLSHKFSYGTYFRIFEKSTKFNTGWKIIFVLRPSNFNVICYQALESTKISSYKPVSNQKYKNGYRTKICNFTVYCFYWRFTSGRKLQDLIMRNKCRVEMDTLHFAQCIASRKPF